jgi:hypothetical protein
MCAAPFLSANGVLGMGVKNSLTGTFLCDAYGLSQRARDCAAVIKPSPPQRPTQEVSLLKSVPTTAR